MLDWFLDWQIKIALIIGIVCIPLIFAFDFRGFQAIPFFFLGLVLIFCGNKLFANETAENWIKFSYFDSIKKIFGGVLMFFGWFILIRQVLALAIASIFLKLG